MEDTHGGIYGSTHGENTWRTHIKDTHGGHKWRAHMEDTHGGHTWRTDVGTHTRERTRRAHACGHARHSRSPVDSMREAVLTVSPKRQ